MPAKPVLPPPSSLSNNTMRAHFFISRQQISIIPCKKYHKVITRASLLKSYQIVPNTLCLQAFQHKNIKKPLVFQQKLFKFPLRALMRKSYKNHRFLMNSAKPTDFMPPRSALAILLSCAHGTNPLQKIPRGPHARTAARA